MGFATRNITFERLNFLLGTVNTRVVEKIVVRPGSGNSPATFDWCDIVIGKTTYRIWLADQDPLTADDKVERLKEILASHDLQYSVEPDPYIYYMQMPTCKSASFSLSDIRKQYARKENS